MKVRMINPNTHQLKTCKVGFSWTLFFFGIFVPIFRGDWKYALVSIIPFSQFVLMFMYNKIYINELIGKGFLPGDNSDKQVLVSKGILMPDAKTDADVNK